MDSREFYRQLMQQYTFDEKKIKRNAKRASADSGARRFLKWLPAACTAAMLAITIGVVSLNAAMGKNGLSVTENPLSALERLQYAQRDYEKLSTQSEEVDMFISFGRDMNYVEMLMTMSAASDTGEIQYRILYLNDRTRTENTYSAIQSLNDSGKLISGVKVTAPYSLYKEIIGLSSVILVELPSANITDEKFVPVSAEELNPTVPQTTVPVTDAPPPETTTQQTTSEPVTTTETEITTEPVTTPPDDTSGEESSGELPPPVEITTLEVSILNARSAFFINETSFVTITDTSLDLYSLTENEETKVSLLRSLSATNLKINWSNAGGTKYLVSGCDGNSQRKLLWLINGEENTISEVKLTAPLVDSEIVFCALDGLTEHTLVLRTANSEQNNIYFGDMKRGEDDAYIPDMTVAASSVTPVSVIGLTHDGVYYSEMSGDALKTALYYCDFEAPEEKTLLREFDETPQFTRSGSLLYASFVSAPDGEETPKLMIFSAVSGGFYDTEIPAVEGMTVQFAATDSAVFGYNNLFYRISQTNGVSPISEERAAVYFRQAEVSAAYGVYEILPETIRIQLK